MEKPWITRDTCTYFWSNVTIFFFVIGVGSDHRGHRSPVRKHATVTQPSMQEGSSFSDSSDQESSSSEAGDSEESCHATVRVTAKPKGSVPSSHYITATRYLFPLFIIYEFHN